MMQVLTLFCSLHFRQLLLGFFTAFKGQAALPILHLFFQRLRRRFKRGGLLGTLPKLLLRLGSGALCGLDFLRQCFYVLRT